MAHPNLRNMLPPWDSTVAIMPLQRMGIKAATLQLSKIAAAQKVTTFSLSFTISYISFIVEMGHISEPACSRDLMHVPQA